jgi:hypothetical protein
MKEWMEIKDIECPSFRFLISDMSMSKRLLKVIVDCGYRHWAYCRFVEVHKLVINLIDNSLENR